MEDPDQVTFFAETDFRGQRQAFGIRAEDRLRHVYVVGKTGVGKSTLLENMAIQDIVNGNGLAFLDPHGSAAETLLQYVPEHRVQDVIYFAPFDTEFPIGFNPLESRDPDKNHLVAHGLVSVFKKIWVDAWSARMEYILINVLLALLETPGSTLLGVNRMLVEAGYRESIIKNITEPSVKDFWENDYGKWDDRYRREAGAAIQNKIGQFTTNPLIRNIVGQSTSTFDFREAIDNKKILIINLSKGRLGETNAKLLGGMLITAIYLAAMSRAEYTKQQLTTLPSFYLYADEFQNFASESFADILSEARKYKLSLTVAHQYIAQLPDEVRDAIFGNAGTLISFLVGETDAEALSKEFAPTFEQADFASLGFAQIYLKLMINGIGSRPFSARTILPVQEKIPSSPQAVITFTRQHFTSPRKEVESAINNWFEPILTEKDAKKKIEQDRYIAQKKAEVEAKGGVWHDKGSTPSSQTKTPDTDEDVPLVLKQVSMPSEPGSLVQRNKTVPRKEPTPPTPDPSPVREKRTVPTKKITTPPPTPDTPGEISASEKLLGMIEKLDAPHATRHTPPAAPITVDVPASPAPSAITSKPPVEEKAPTTTPRSPYRKGIEREAKNSSKDALRIALQRAISQKEEKKASPQQEVPVKPHEPRTDDVDYSEQQPRSEVPEPVLREILR